MHENGSQSEVQIRRVMYQKKDRLHRCKLCPVAWKNSASQGALVNYMFSSLMEKTWGTQMVCNAAFQFWILTFQISNCIHGGGYCSHRQQSVARPRWKHKITSTSAAVQSSVSSFVCITPGQLRQDMHLLGEVKSCRKCCRLASA